jgi:hypothetical protein
MELKLQNITADNVTSFDDVKSATVQLELRDPSPELSRIIWSIMSPAQRFIIYALASDSSQARRYFEQVPACECKWDDLPPSMRDTIAVLSYELAIVRTK